MVGWGRHHVHPPGALHGFCRRVMRLAQQLSEEKAGLPRMLDLSLQSYQSHSGGGWRRAGPKARIHVLAMTHPKAAMWPLWW